MDPFDEIALPQGVHLAVSNGHQTPPRLFYLIRALTVWPESRPPVLAPFKLINEDPPNVPRCRKARTAACPLNEGISRREFSVEGVGTPVHSGLDHLGSHSDNICDLRMLTEDSLQIRFDRFA